MSSSCGYFKATRKGRAETGMLMPRMTWIFNVIKKGRTERDTLVLRMFGNFNKARLRCCVRTSKQRDERNLYISTSLHVLVLRNKYT
jgi:hypothetical protein